MVIQANRVSKRQLFLLIGDFFVLIVAPIISIYMFLWIKLGPSFDFGNFNVQIQPIFILFNMSMFVVVLYIFELYNYQQDFRKKETLFQIFIAICVGGISSNFLMYLFGIPPQGRGIFLLYLLTVLSGIISVRFLYSVIGSSRIYDKKTLILGCGESGRAILRVLQKNNYSGIDVIGFLDRDPEKCDSTVGGVCVYYIKDDLKQIVRQHKPQLLIVALHRGPFNAAIDSLIWCAQQGLEIWDVPTAYERIDKRIPLKYVDSSWLLSAAINWPKMQIGKGKRVLDFIISILLLIFSSPIMVLTALSIWIESKRPIILTQNRIGKNGKIIRIYKFKSMRQELPKTSEKGTDLNDKRVTFVGRIIRKLHIDELPQLYNVIKGEMSIVGPRAELFDFVYEYIGNPLEEESFGREYAQRINPEKKKAVGIIDRSEGLYNNPKDIIPYIEQRFTVNQGITGWAQIMHPFVSSTYDDMVKKLEYDLYYIKNMSFFLDIIILLKTIRIVLLGRGK